MTIPRELCRLALFDFDGSNIESRKTDRMTLFLSIDSGLMVFILRVK